MTSPQPTASRFTDMFFTRSLNQIFNDKGMLASDEQESAVSKYVRLVANA